MKNLIYSITILLIYSLSGCKVCKNIDYCPPPASAQTYFGAYVQGAYWIYYNQDSTKVDSVYITDFEMKRERNSSDDCIEWDTKIFLLQSEYLSPKVIEVDISNDGRCEQSSVIFRITSTMGICLGVNNETPYFENCAANEGLELLNEFILDEKGNISFENTIKYDNRFWFAPDVGIVKYITQDNFDTLYLNKYHIP